MELSAAVLAREVPVLQVSGDVDLATADGLRAAAEAMLRGCDGLMIIDLSAVTFLDSSGMRVLDDVQREAADLDATIALVCPERRLIKLLEITGLDQRFAIHATAEEPSMLPQTKPDALLRLGLSLTEPARARAFVDDYLVGCSRHTRDDARLLVSELVTNVIRHGALPATVSLRVARPRLHIVVADSGSPLPEQPWVVDVQATSGRGLIIMSSIAEAWGVSTTPGQVGKEIWFDLAV